MSRFVVYLIAYLITIGVNFLANFIPINGQTTGEIAERVNVLITPAPYTFAIWGLIYLLLAIWILRMIPLERRDLPLYQKAFCPFLFSCLFNVSWILSWHYELFIVSVLVMIFLLISLITLYVKIKTTNPSFFDITPFSVYLSWVSVATIVNISFVLEFYNWSGWGVSEVMWTIVLLIASTVLALVFTKREHDLIYPLVFVWAFIGIGVKNWEGEKAVSNIAFILAGVLLAGVFYIRKNCWKKYLY